MRNDYFCSAMCLGLVFLAAGCEGGSAKPASVHGKVYYQGWPVYVGTIVFTPDESQGGHGPIPRAEIQRDGSYVLHTDGKPGAMPGPYRITIMAVEPGTVYAAPRSLLPDKYRIPEMSGLTCEVKAGCDNAVNFNLN